jgi:hypothetical protein
MIQTQETAKGTKSIFASTTNISLIQAETFLESWGKGLLAIAAAKRNGEDYESLARSIISKHYAYETGEVLFKPTLASTNTFRKTFDGALSYFVAGSSRFEEDNGFALVDWKDIEFEIAGFYAQNGTALIMGNKHLSKSNGEKVVANFSMALIQDMNGQLKIKLHHSSLPYQPA